MEKTTMLYCDTPERFGKNIQLRRTAQAMTIVQLADKAGVSRQALSRLEKGAPATRLDTAIRVMVALDIQIPFILAGREQ